MYADTLISEADLYYRQLSRDSITRAWGLYHQAQGMLGRIPKERSYRDGSNVLSVNCWIIKQILYRKIPFLNYSQRYIRKISLNSSAAFSGTAV
ncbi:hypothetical protein UA45_04570 [Morganella morganii]|uniref:Uncharacterized protein n=1 Tax=Morganella morganii TaxID=582 RepID=A0A0D8L9Y9_MORMO|nr:hypothetical protein UA45_04570 [Morganella morganii]